MDISSIGAVLSGTKTLIDLAGIALAARDDAKLADALQSLKERIFDIQNAALQTQEKMSTMQDQVETLKNDKRELNAKIAELQKRLDARAEYGLKEVNKGVFVLEYIKPDDGGDPPHYICQPCMDNAAKKVVLQRKPTNGRVNLVCNQCNAIHFTGETYTIRTLDPSSFR